MVYNQAACHLLTKGSSSQDDLCFIAFLVHLLFAKFRCRVYFEYVESAANPSDGFSRAGLSAGLGLSDAWTLQQGWVLSQAHLPDLMAIAASSLSEALLLCSIGNLV